MFANSRHRRALTLMELIIVLIVLIALAGIAVPLMTTATRDSERRATLVTMTQLRDVLIGTRQRPGYLQDMQGVSVSGNATGIPDKLEDLFKLPTGAAVFDIDTRLGWRGPYLTNLTGKYDATKPSFSAVYGTTGAPALLDGWGNPIVLQWPQTADSLEIRAKYVRLVSAGPPSQSVGGVLYSVIDSDATKLKPEDLLPASRGNDLVMFLRVADLYAPDIFVTPP